MCSVPPKFFQVCRLCLTLIEEDDISAHRIYNSNSLSSDSCNKIVNTHDSGGNSNASKNVSKCHSCVKFRDEDIKNQLITSTNSSLPRVPLSTYFQIYSKNIAIDNNCPESHENKIYTPSQSNSMFNKSAEYSEESLDDGPKQKFLDESLPKLSVQILNCLSLEVSHTSNT